MERMLCNSPLLHGLREHARLRLEALRGPSCLLRGLAPRSRCSLALFRSAVTSLPSRLQYRARHWWHTQTVGVVSPSRRPRPVTPPRPPRGLPRPPCHTPPDRPAPTSASDAPGLPLEGHFVRHLSPHPPPPFLWSPHPIALKSLPVSPWSECVSDCGLVPEAGQTAYKTPLRPGVAGRFPGRLRFA